MGVIYPLGVVRINKVLHFLQQSDCTLKILLVMCCDELRIGLAPSVHQARLLSLHRMDKSRLTLPARLANWLHIHLHQGVLSSGFLSTVVGGHQDLVLVLLVIAQLLGVPDVA